MGDVGSSPSDCECELVFILVVRRDRVDLGSEAWIEGEIGDIEPREFAIGACHIQPQLPQIWVRRHGEGCFAVDIPF